MAVVDSDVDIPSLRQAVRLRAWDKCPTRNCRDYANVLSQHSVAVKESGDLKLSIALQFLARVCVLPFRPASDAEQLGSELDDMILSVGRFDESELSALK